MSQSPQPTAPPEAALQHILQLGTGYILSGALNAVVRLRIPDRLASGPKRVDELAREAGAHEDALYRVMRALAMAGVFVETTPRSFALTPPGELLCTDRPGSAHDLIAWISDPFHLRVYAELPHALRTGETVGERVAGMPVWDYLAKDVDLGRRFNDAMSTFSAQVAPAVLKAYAFRDIGVLADVAGGHGILLASVLREYPKMRGILFDQDHVLAGHRLKELGVEERVQAVPGDFFKSVPAGADAYIMKHIIHDWDDERATRILRNVGTALHGRAGGRVILIESVVRPGNEPDLSKLIDLEMMLLPGGRERTADEFAALFAGAGFELTRIVPTESPLSVIEARPSA
jgi:hypothetical protein